MVKLSRRGVDELVDPGDCERFEPLPGQAMKEWLALRARSSLDWFSLAEEAPDFVLSA